MNKRTVDNLIAEYFQKIYGFAVKKSFSYAEAEDLCADIVKEVYISLLKADAVTNPEGYIWRISEHTYSRFVSSKKKHEGLSLNGMVLPFYDDLPFEDTEEDLLRLRREIAFLTEVRRKIVYMFYYENQSISCISRVLGIPSGTVKWHLNKARHDLKEGFSMERKIGKLGLSPVAATNFSHSGSPDPYGGPEYYLSDKRNLNIVYSVYRSPKTKKEIAEELGITPVYIEDAITMLESNGFLVRIKGDRYTTYVCFEDADITEDAIEVYRTAQHAIAQTIASDYVPTVRQALKDVQNVYIPGGNRELFEATAILIAITHRCRIASKTDLSRYIIKTLAGGRYITWVDLEKPTDTDRCQPNEYWTCGGMTRDSDKYPSIYSWAIDSKLSSRTGTWKNNLYSDYEYVYEWMSGMLPDTPANSEKIARLKERQFLTDDGKINITVFGGTWDELLAKLPPLDDDIRKQFTDIALDMAMHQVDHYPPQMHDLIINQNIANFIGSSVGIMVLDILYQNGTFRPLTDNEKITANLLMFSDVLPQDS